MGSIFGRNLTVTTFGESHGPALGVVVDGLPAGLAVDPAAIQADLDRRRPGQTAFATPRNEPDRAEILSGLTAGGLTNGAPLAIVIRNLSARPADYAALADRFRPGHADWTYHRKYGLPPQSGGGRASGRETAARVAAGALARILLRPMGITVRAATAAVGPLKAIRREWDLAEADPLRFLDPDLAGQAQAIVAGAKAGGDSVGSVVEFEAEGVPPGLGGPIFDKLEAVLGHAFLSIGAVRAVEFGDGVAAASSFGSQANDPIGPDGPAGGHHGGILGGISTGRPIVARLYVKPTPSIALRQDTATLDGQPATIKVGGRHDPCLAPRLAPVAEAMGLLVLADFVLAGPSRLGG
jgi:chorismate synthase